MSVPNQSIRVIETMTFQRAFPIHRKVFYYYRVVPWPCRIVSNLSERIPKIKQSPCLRVATKY
jgi:hypothetical protein